MGDFWRGSQPFFSAKPFAPARFAVPGAPSLTALSRHDSHNSLPLCLPSGGCLAHQHTPSELICLFFDSGHLPNTVFTLFYLTCSDCTLWRSGTASLTTGTRNLQEEAYYIANPPVHSHQHPSLTTTKMVPWNSAKAKVTKPPNVRHTSNKANLIYSCCYLSIGPASVHLLYSVLCHL